MNKLSLTANSSKNWHTNLKTAATRLAWLLALVCLFPLVTGASSFFVQDNA
ncbi:MAG: methanol dehydrogenase, partial [Lactobacillus delbrueckii]